jgi:MerR family transcriptional regulator, light-induced transcriptional regulator
METIDGRATARAIRSRAMIVKRRNPAAVERLVEAELLPRIARLHGQAIAMQQGRPGAFAAHEIVEFAQAALRSDDRLLATVQRHVARGRALETIYLELLQPAARHLGDLWTDDAVDFATVTLGLCQMHRIVRELSPAFHVQGARRGDGCHALLTPAGKEQHSLGLAMVGEFLRREGWLVSSGPFAGLSGLAAAVRSDWLTLVGFSLSCDRGLDELATQIRCVRQVSLNRDVWVLVGGRVFTDHPQLVARVGADAMACDARQAAIVSRRLAATPAECRT